LFWVDVLDRAIVIGYFQEITEHWNHADDLPTFARYPNARLPDVGLRVFFAEKYGHSDLLVGLTRLRRCDTVVPKIVPKRGTLHPIPAHSSHEAEKG
jgi:hypothetical protein